MDDDDLHAELTMIDENLCRAGLGPVDGAKQITRRKALYEELHPEAKHGGDRKSSRQIGNLRDDRFTKETAAKTGKSERAVQRAAKRGKQTRLKDIFGTSLDKGVELDALAELEKTDPVKRGVLIDRAAAGESVSASRQGQVAGAEESRAKADSEYGKGAGHAQGVHA